MSSITAQQTKLDLKLVPKEKRLDIGKWNGRIPKSTQIYGKLLPETLTSPEMKESKAYNTYLGYASGDVPPKIARKFKKASPSKKDRNLVYVDEEPAKKENEEEVKDDDEEEDKVIHTLSNSDDEDDANLESKNDDKIEGDEDRGMDDTTKQFIDDVDARLNEPTQTDKEVVQDKEADVEITDAQQEKENLEITQEQVVEDANVTILTVVKETVVPVFSSSHSSELALKFLNFTNIHPNNAEIVSPLDVQIHHEVPSTHTSTLLTVLVSVILNHHQVNALEKEVAELKKDPLHTQVTALVDDHLDTRMGETKEEFMNFLSASLTARITEQVKNQLPQILPEEVSNFASPAAATLTEFELKRILIDKMNKSESYLAAPEHQECYDGLIKSYNLDKDFFSSYDVYSLKQSQKDKDKDEGPSVGSDWGFKKRKTSKDVEPTIGPKIKDSTSSSSKGTKSQPKSYGKTVQSEEPEIKVGDTDMPQDQEGNLGNDDDEPKKETISRRNWFTKPT
uniref:Retrovirus-related Pol polyprotein from transposon TNT 1-94 n=1 Tax=Tanacetum cinerariifolium TaxID=118510 RepID=A0A6L2NR87_TANCI|nr:hypothetical protein [Tanacetum cinerariifolium]